MSETYRYTVNGTEFELAEEIDVSLISKYGEIIQVFDKNDSGNISFVIEKDKKYFLKVAGFQTCNSQIERSDVINNLRRAGDVYKAIEHPDIVSPIEYWEDDGLAFMLFPYVEGECLFDHWNFEYYERNSIIPPLQKFLSLDIDIKMHFAEALFEFYKAVNKAGYIATDFYEGSIIYNFGTNRFYFCDLDFFTKCRSINESGFQWGPDRFLAPEEKTKGQLLDERTDVYHIGVFIRIIFTDHETGEWQLSKEKYDIIGKATSLDTNKRYSDVEEFEMFWRAAE